MDLGGPTSYYAAKSFADTVNNRRLVWAWVRLGEQALEAVDEEGDKIAGFHAGGCPGIGSVMTNTNSMAREITYDPQLQTLNFFPVSEMAALRRKVRNTHLLRHFILQRIILPRQARDKHRENSIRVVFFAGARRCARRHSRRSAKATHAGD